LQPSRARTGVAYQLTVTRRGTVPDIKGAVHEWVGIEHFGFNGKKRSKNKRYHRLHDGRQIWGGRGLVNGAAPDQGVLKASRNS
jgi:hypothetical protein